MYSVYLHDREKQKQKHHRENLIKVKKSVTAQIKLRSELVKNHQRRTEKRVIEMAYNPIPIYRTISTARNTDYLGEPMFRLKPKNAHERIRDSLEKNQILDAIPNKNHSKIQFRDRLRFKEINPDLKFTPRDRYERISDSLLLNNTLLNTWMLPEKINKHSLSKHSDLTLPGEIKNYYKTIESLVLDVSPSLKSNLY